MGTKPKKIFAAGNAAAVIAVMAVLQCMPVSAAEKTDAAAAQYQTAVLTQQAQTEQKKVPMILDTDMATDVDDATAFRIAAELSCENIVSLKGVAFSVNPGNGNEVRAAEGVLDYMGLNDVPVAQCAVNHYDASPYYGSMWVYKTHDHTVYENAVQMYKDILRASDTKVRIVTTGFLLNIQALLSDPEGYALMKEKCEGIWIAGGEYSGMCWNLSYQPDVTAASVYVNGNSPVPLYFAMDVLGANRCGGALTAADKNDSDFLSKCFASFGLADGENYGNCDGTAVYCCAMAGYGYGNLYRTVPCTVSINKSNGALTQTASDTDTGRYMLETTQVTGKYALYGSKFYTSVMDRIILADWNRKHPAG